VQLSMILTHPETGLRGNRSFPSSISKSR